MIRALTRGIVGFAHARVPPLPAPSPPHTTTTLQPTHPPTHPHPHPPTNPPTHTTCRGFAPALRSPAATVGGKFVVYMHAAGQTKRVFVRDGDKDVLAETYIAMFYINEGRPVPEGVEPATLELFMKDPKHGVYYENFMSNHVLEGSEIAVKDPSRKDIPVASFQGEALAVLFGMNAEEVLSSTSKQAALARMALAAAGEDDPEAEGVGGGGAQGQEQGADGAPDARRGEGDVAGQGAADGNSALGSEALRSEVRRVAGDLKGPTLRERIWITLDDPQSSKLAAGVTLFTLALIMLSTITFCLETLPFFYEEETNFDSKWFVMEAVCIAFFTVEITMRLLTCPALGPYFKDTMNIIDIVAVLPFYIEVTASSASIPGLSVLRVIRLVRVFRLLKMSKGSITVFALTMKRSARPLYMLIFFTLIAMVVFGSLIYFMERGAFDSDVQQWMRTVGYECPLIVERDELTAADNSWTIDDRVAALGEVPPLSLKESSCVFVQTVRDAEGVVPTEGPFEAEYSCQFTWKRNSGCVSIKEVTPFESIPTSFWWALVTMTTVGYGDMWPVYWYGKALGMIIMLSGILVIALPITVIGANFAEVYKEAMIYQDNKVAQSSGRSSGRRGAAA